MADRAVLFVDGSNWYHALQENGVYDTFNLNYAKISEKLTTPRQWVATRYYGVTLNQRANPTLYANNRRFLSNIQKDDPRISVHLGRVEPRPMKNPLAQELLGYIVENRRKMGGLIEGQLRVLANRYLSLTDYKEKGVDVRLAVDMYRLAHANAYDAAYLLSADGDFVPAVEAVKELGKTVYAACPNFGSALDKVCKSFICMPRSWFDDCYR